VRAVQIAQLPLDWCRPLAVERFEPSEGMGSPLEAVAQLDRNGAPQLAEHHLARLAKWDRGRTARIVDKMVENYLYLGLLAALFPQAVFIHCRRVLRDVAWSCWITDFRSIR